jgi:hypothetical protein
LSSQNQHGRYLPGEDVIAAWKLVLYGSLAASFLFGLLYSGGALLLLQEDRHVSATRFFVLTVGLQLALTAVSLVSFGLRRGLRERIGHFDSLRVMLTGLVLRWRRLSPDGRLRRALSMLHRRRNAYRGIVFGHAVLATQACFVAMTIGILISLAGYHFAVRDVRFGWSATYDWKTTTVVDATSLIALPWAMMLPQATLTSADVEASRLTPDEPGKRVPADASRAWKNFLLASLVFYGVFLRLVIAWIAARGVSRETRSIEMRHAEAEALWQRLITPLPGEEPPAEEDDAAADSASWWGRFKSIFSTS